MRDEEQLAALLDAWQEAQSLGEDLSPEELCRDCTGLLPELSRKVAILRRFETLRGAVDNSPNCEWRCGVWGMGLYFNLHSALRTPHSTRSSLPRMGEEFGGYQIVALLGEGGMGCVYRATDPVLNREVALKVMRPKVAARPEARARFLREARALAALHHDHVVPIYQVAEVRGIPFLAMPLLQGESLATRLARDKPLPITELLRIGAEVLAGLAAVHAQGLVHRDMSPANIWLERTAESSRVKVLDFGLAQERCYTADTGERTLFGTPAYMSPEQADRQPLDGRADLFSLGSVFYECATGQRPFQRKSLTATLVAVSHHQLKPAHEVNPAVPVALSDLIQQLLAKSPHDRPASAEVVADTLRDIWMLPEYDRRCGACRTTTRRRAGGGNADD